MADLGCSKTTAPGDLDLIAAESKWPSIVEEFRTQRSAHPRGTGGQLQRMGRPDIDPLHGPAGGRACTWFDEESGICWFLGFTPDHDYRMLEARAARGELLPTEDDEVRVELEWEELDFELRVRPGLQALLQEALSSPGTPAKGRIGKLLRVEVSVTVVLVGAARLADLFLVVRLPLRPEGEPPPPGWPGGELAERLLGICTGSDNPQWDAPATVPDVGGTMRPVDPAEEIAMHFPSWEL